MKTQECMVALTLLLVAEAHALNTVSALSQKGWEPAQPGLVEEVGPAHSPARAPAEQPEPFGGAFPPMLGSCPDLLTTQMDDPATSLHPQIWSDQAVVGRFPPDLIDGFGGAEGEAGSHWSIGPRECADGGLLPAGAHIDLPVLADLDLADTALPTPAEASLMETFVFPALAALLFASGAAALVLRLRRRKTVSRTEQLLQV